MESESNKFLQKWGVLKGVDEKQLEEIKFFNEFQTYTGDQENRDSCAIFLTTGDEVFVIGHNNEDNLLALSGDDFAKRVVVKQPKKIEALSGKNIRKIVVAERFGAALTEDGKLLYWGTNMEHTRYESRDSKYVKEPHEPNPDLKIVDFACGAHSMTFVTDENQVLIWGCINLYYSSFYAFEKVEMRRELQVRSIACGWAHVAMVDQKGQVWTFGTGSVGQLGYKRAGGSELYDEITPKKVNLPEPCTKVECGINSTLYLLKNGELYASGSNAKSDHLCVGKNGYVFTPVKVKLDEHISDIAATFAWFSRSWQSLYSATSKDGTKYFKWGNDKKLETPQVSDDSQSFLEVFANFKTPQSIGELVRVDVVPLPGIGKTEPKPKPIFANRSILNRWKILEEIDEDFKRNISYFTVFEGHLGGNKHVFGSFLKTKNTDDVYHWGDIGHGKLGLSSSREEMSPQKVESLSGKNIKKILLNFNGGLALSNESDLYVWDPESLPYHLEDKLVGDVACGFKFYVYYDLTNQSKDVYVDGQMSTDFSNVSHQKISLPNSEKPIALSAGAWHFLVLTDKSNVYAFGDGRYGQLGSSDGKWKKNDEDPFKGSKINVPGPVKKIMCGTSSSFFLTDKGELFACGSNTYADPLGIGHSKSVNKPEKVKINEKVVDVAGSLRINSFGGQISSFALKTASGKIYKWEGGKIEPKELVKSKFLVEAFADEEIPQSLSLVRLSSLGSESDDEDEPEILLRGPIGLGIPPEKILYNDPLYSDVTIKLKDGVIASHKVLLHIKSPFFRKALSSNKVVDQEELDFASYNSKAVRALLMHVYDLPIGQRASDLNDVLEFVKLAKEDGNPELILIAEDILVKNLVFDLYMADETNAALPNSKDLKELRDFIDSSVFPEGPRLTESQKITFPYER